MSEQEKEMNVLAVQKIIIRAEEIVNSEMIKSIPRPDRDVIGRLIEVAKQHEALLAQVATPKTILERLGK